MFRLLIAGPYGRPSHLVFPSGQPGRIFDPLLHRRPAAQAQIASDLLSRPTPDSLIGVEVRAVARQVHQPQLQLRRPEVLPHRLPTMGRRIVPDDPQRLDVQLSGRQLRSRCCCCPPVHLAGLWTPPKVAGLWGTNGLPFDLLPAGIRQRILAPVRWASSPTAYSARLPLGLISLEQPLLGTLEGKPQPVKPVQATAAAGHKLHHLPIP